MKSIIMAVSTRLSPICAAEARDKRALTAQPSLMPSCGKDSASQREDARKKFMAECLEK